MRIKVGLYGMDERSMLRMETVFRMVYKEQCIVAETASADTVIFDMDNKDVEHEWSDFRNQYPDIPVVIMATEPVQIDDVPYIEKPAKLPELLEVLKRTSKKNINTSLNFSVSSTHKVAESLQKKDKNGDKRSQQQVKHEDLYYNPEKFLQGKVYEAVKTANEKMETVFIRCWSDRWIIISPNSDYVFENIKESQLRYLGLVNIDNDVVYQKEIFTEKQISEMAETPVHEVKSTPISKFLWDVTVRTSRGRVPVGTSLDDIYVLTHWPNLTRVSRIPNAMKICSFWLEQAQSINDIYEKLSIPLEDVCTFFSAAFASGELIHAKRVEDHIVKPEVIEVEPKKKGILSAIMRKISKKIQPEEHAA